MPQRPSAVEDTQNTSGCKLSGLEFKKNSLGLAHGQLLMKPKIISAKSLALILHPKT